MAGPSEAAGLAPPEDGGYVDLGAAIKGSLDGIDGAEAGLTLGIKRGALDLGLQAGLSLVGQEMGYFGRVGATYHF